VNKLLIIDDNPDDIEITRIALGERGRDIQVEAYRSAQTALAVLREARDLPDLVLLDLNIPGMGGIECLRQIRADSRLQSLPVIMVTSSSYDADQKKAYDAGADFFLFKDFDMDRYGESLDAALKRLIM
jgi:CheY-like chemotaxis protein